MRFERGLCYPPTFTMKRPDPPKRAVFAAFFAWYSIGFSPIPAHLTEKSNRRSGLYTRPPERQKAAYRLQKRAPAPVTIRRQRAKLRRADGLGVPFSKFSPCMWNVSMPDALMQDRFRATGAGCLHTQKTAGRSAARSARNLFRPDRHTSCSID